MAAVDELMGPDFVDDEEATPEVPPGLEGVKQLFTMIPGALTDIHAIVEDLIAEGDRVVARPAPS